MVKLNLLGDWFSASGFSSHFRQFSSALHRLNKETSVETNAPANWEQMVSPEDAEMFKNNYRLETNICISSPPIWLLKKSEHPKKLIGFGVFEGSRIPTGFIKPSNAVDAIFVPSKHVYDAFKPFVDRPIFIVPEGVDMNVFKEEHTFHPQIEEFNHATENSAELFTFLWNKGWALGTKDRSGFDIAVKAFSEEFTKTDKVRFLAHINPAYNHPMWDIRREMDALKLPLNNNRAPMSIMTSDLPIPLINQFYNLGDVYISTSKAEGFNLPVLEAMACGKPAIVSNYGGHLDFCDESNSWLISGEMKRASDPNPMFEEVDWFECNVEEVKKAMRFAYEHQDIVKKKSEEALKTARAFSWENAAKIALTSIDKLS